jgi:hypothetical protein
MNDLTELVLRAAIIGSGGAALMDLWGAIARRLLGIQGLDYALLGRWIGHLPHGRFVHERIASAEPVFGERALGWIAHYAIGIGFALVLLAIWGLEWGRIPAIGPAMLVGMGTILAPWLVMQPAMGAGIAGSRTPNPTATRARNLVTHAVYGIGLYVSAVGLSVVWP